MLKVSTNCFDSWQKHDLLFCQCYGLTMNMWCLWLPKNARYQWSYKHVKKHNEVTDKIWQVETIRTRGQGEWGSKIHIWKRQPGHLSPRQSLVFVGFPGQDPWLPLQARALTRSPGPHVVEQWDQGPHFCHLLALTGPEMMINRNEKAAEVDNLDTLRPDNL